MFLEQASARSIMVLSDSSTLRLAWSIAWSRLEHASSGYDRFTSGTEPLCRFSLRTSVVRTKYCTWNLCYQHSWSGFHRPEGWAQEWHTARMFWDAVQCRFLDMPPYGVRREYPVTLASRTAQRSGSITFDRALTKPLNWFPNRLAR